MRTIVRLAALVAMCSWGAALSAAPLVPAAPVTGLPVRVSIALPVAQFDFSDLDVRDEFNRPVAMPAIRARFEQLLNRQLSQLLIQNLTPARRAWMELVSRDRFAFSQWLTRAAGRTAAKILAFIASAPRVTRVWRAWAAPLASAAPVLSRSDGDPSGFLLSCVIASTRLLR